MYKAIIHRLRIATPPLGTDHGYVLVATILLGLAISIIGVTNLQFTANSEQSLTSQSYQTMAQEAARSGIAYASSCFTQGISGWTGSAPLRPNVSCSGAPAAGSAYLNSTPEWRSTFSVSPRDTQDNITATGKVEILSGGVPVKTFTATNKMGIGVSYEERDTATGQALTAIKADKSACAIANGKLYCWGANLSAQLGLGDLVNRSRPALVQGALQDKTVTKVSVSDSSVCAIADGRPYCWGGNAVNQLGNGLSLLNPIVIRPQENTPRTSSGPLRDKHVIDIGTASTNNPAGPIWPFASALQHSCALTADGSVSCWGYGGFRQNTGGSCLLLFRCIYPSESYPRLVKGYRDNTGHFAGKKGVRIGASSHDSCVVANGVLYCWGVEAPLFPEGFSQSGLTLENVIDNVFGIGRLACTLPLGMFSDPMLTLYPINPCVMTYTNSYDATHSELSQAWGTFIDPPTFDVSSNEGCWMAENDFYCFGVTPAYATFWMEAFRAPWRVINNTDVTDADNGDSNDFIAGGFVGLYCIVEKGVGKCAGQPGNINTGADGIAEIWYKQFSKLSTRTAPELAESTATKIAAGYHFGCVIANGRLFCWGDGLSGGLANGSFLSRNDTPRLAGKGGSMPIGIDGADQYAAHDSVSTGSGHSCGIANGKLFCWGKNSSGQLGVGSSPNLKQPRVVSMATPAAFTKVSAGKNHTCAIANGSLYCWGSNSNGQLGIPGGNVNTPRLVNGNGALTTSMRVTDVSAGATGTCAIANAKVFCWGNNTNGQVGDGTNSNRSLPVLLSTGSNLLNGKAATNVSLGVTHACAVANSDLYCWGSNSNRQLGIPGGDVNSPRLVNQGAANAPRGPNNVLPAVSAVSAGNNFTCAIFNATVSCWGSNSRGQTGKNPSSDIPVPTPISGAANGYYATAITAGYDHACALLQGNNSKKNGNLFCWGSGSEGKLGYGTTADRYGADSPIIGTTGTSVMRESDGGIRSTTAISAGESGSCAIANAVILCWGKGNDGQIGNGKTDLVNTEPFKTEKYQVSKIYGKGPVF